MRIYQPTLNSYYSGAGGLDIGLMQAGVKVVQSLDIDKRATIAMRSNTHYFSHSVINCDIADKTVLDQPASDVYAFTYPCDRYSEIADIHGVRTGDELYLHALRHTAIGRPEMFVAENVPGMKKFPVVMEAMTKLPDYYFNILCPIKSETWLPQRRDRLIIIATKKPFTVSYPKAPRVKPTIKSLLEKGAKVNVPNYVIARIKGKYRDKPIIVDPSNKNEIAPTCVAHYHKDLSTRMVIDKTYRYGLRPFTIREYARLQGFPDDYFFPDTQSSYMLIGNAVSIPVGRWIGQQIIQYFNTNKKSQCLNS